MGHVELLFVFTGWMWALRLSFRSRLKSSCLMMLTSQLSSMIRSHGSLKWKCLIPFTTHFSSLPIAWGASQHHHSISNLLLLRLYCWQPQLIIARCLNTGVERRPQLCCLKMNIEVHLAHPLLSALLYPIPHSIPPFPHSSARDGSSSIPTGAPIMHSALLTRHVSALLHWDKHSSISSVLLWLDWFSSMSFRTPWPPPTFGAPQFHCALLMPTSFRPPQLGLDPPLVHSALLQHLLCYSSFHTTLPISALHYSPGSCSQFSSECIILPLIPPFRFTAR